jgi:hypothetical protein
MFLSSPHGFFDKVQTPRTWHARAPFKAVGWFFAGLQGWASRVAFQLRNRAP